MLHPPTMSLPAYLRVLSILDVLLSVEEPVGDLVLAWVANNGHHTLNLNTLSSIQFYYVASLSGYFQQFFFQKISINREFLPKVKSSLNENTKLITFDRCMKQRHSFVSLKAIWFRCLCLVQTDLQVQSHHCHINNRITDKPVSRPIPPPLSAHQPSCWGQHQPSCKQCSRNDVQYPKTVLTKIRFWTLY